MPFGPTHPSPSTRTPSTALPRGSISPRDSPPAPGGGGRMSDPDAAAQPGDGGLAARNRRSGGGLADVASGGSGGASFVGGGGGDGAGEASFLGGVGGGGAPFLSALLAAAGLPPGMVADAWSGFPGAGVAGAEGAGHGAASWGGIPPAAGVTVGNTGIPSNGGWPEWMNSTIVAALGPDWLRAHASTSRVVTGAAPAVTNETSSQDVERLPVPPTSQQVRGTSR
jgi:hypothetical protein